MAMEPHVKHRGLLFENLLEIGHCESNPFCHLIVLLEYLVFPGGLQFDLTRFVLDSQISFVDVQKGWVWRSRDLNGCCADS